MNAAVSYIDQNFPLIYRLLSVRLKTTLLVLAAGVLLIAAASFAIAIATSDNLFTKAGPIIGGDYIVFREAALAAGGPDMAAIYDLDTLDARFEETYPGKGVAGLVWMYPPTMSLVIAPFALPPYLASFALWVAAFAGLFLATARRLWRDPTALFFIIASPAFYLALITGQNGFLTAALIALAGAFARSRPIIAGVAAGLLTVKPQLGLLIPIAFLAAGCWRAIFVAAATALALAALSVAVYGPDVWVAFIDSVLSHSARMDDGGFPFNKIVTPLAFLITLGAPLAIAAPVQLGCSLAAAAYIALIWRRVADDDLRAAALSTAALIATPYAFYYELIIAAPALLLIARRAVATGWLPYERQMMVAAWVLPLAPAPTLSEPGFPAYPIAAMLAFAIVARRALPAATIRSFKPDGAFS